ncbi:MAG: 30S ribosomal protein S12 methylthiotransferase RimO [Planctomycetota bacterium]
MSRRRSSSRSVPGSADPPAVSLVNLGCPKSLIDAEKMLGGIAVAGGLIAENPDDADTIIINTCAFIEAAREESWAAIREAVARKKKGQCRRVVVAGCLAQRYGAKIRAEEPGVDAVVGFTGRDRILDVVRRMDRIAGGAVVVADPSAMRYDDRVRLRITPRHYAYLRLSEGCDHPCAFCAIPIIRGRHRSKPVAQVLEEAAELAADGAAELNLVAQDTTFYGRDLPGNETLATILPALADIRGVEWVRVLYAYPAHVTDELMAVMNGHPRIVPYLDMPVQHLSSTVLRRMRRGGDRAFLDGLVGRLRERIPGVALRTTVLTGFPGETEVEFEELLAGLRELKFDRLGAFAFSPEAGTPAADLPDPVPAALAAERAARVMAVQREIAAERNHALIGRTVRVLVDEAVSGREGRFTGRGRTAHDAPEIDGVVLVKSATPLAPGAFVDVLIEKAEVHDLEGTAVGG